MSEIEEYFVDSGVRPGFPGNHGPGWYLVDYENRTIRPKPVDVVDTLPIEETPVESPLNAKNEVSTPEPEEQPAEDVAEPASSE